MKREMAILTERALPWFRPGSPTDAFAHDNAPSSAFRSATGAPQQPGRNGGGRGGELTRLLARRIYGGRI